MALCPYSGVNCRACRIVDRQPIFKHGTGASMNALDQLNSYLQSIEKRLKWFAFSSGSALTAVAALVVTVLLVLVMNQLAFSHTSVAVSRFLLFLAIGAALAFGIVIPWMRATRRNAARSAERQFPEFQ